MAIDRLRRRASRPVMQPLESVGALEPQARQDDSHAERGLDLARLRQAFVDLADGLSPQQRAVFTLRELEGLPGPEVARILGLGDSTVRNHLMQARKALRRGLREKYPELLREFGVTDVPGGKHDD
jgi:RNA polymerase sigma factor (sigma-70 family)